MANRNFNQFLFSLHKMLTQIDCSLNIQQGDAAGLGHSSFKGPGILSCFLHTSTTPGSMNGVLNPNPVNGSMIVTFEDTYNKFLGFDSSFGMGQVGTATLGTALKIDNAALTVGTLYVISTLGDATVANWNTVGVPTSVVPKVGVVFMATATQFGAGNVSTSRVSPTVTASTLCTVEQVGLPSVSQPVTVKGIPRFQLMFQFRDFAGAIVTPLDGQTLNMGFQFVNSSAFTPQE